MARLAAAHLVAAGIDPGPIFRQAGLTVTQMKDAESYVAANCQVALLNLAADALHDDLLGFHLAEEFELRLVDLLYFVLASSATLGEALAHIARYNPVANESMKLICEQGKELKIGFSYAGMARHTDRHQMEFWITALVRVSQHLTGRNLRPVRINVTHPRCAASARLEAYLGCAVTFAAGRDEIVFTRRAAELPLKDAEPYLNKVLVRHCEDILSRRITPATALQVRVENAIAPLLPEGKVQAGGIARVLGIGRRTLTRRLAEENLTFNKILVGMRRELAQHYLKDPSISISEIAWRVGYREVAAFTTAFKRWTGVTPSQMRKQNAIATTAAS
jgi:AraC-like DNA-binding protein